MSQVLNGLGAKVKELPEGLIIEGLAGEQMSGGTADGANDHRIVMMAAISSLLCKEPVIITPLYDKTFRKFLNLCTETI